MSTHPDEHALDRWLQDTPPQRPEPALEHDEAFVQRVMQALPARQPDLARAGRWMPQLQALALGSLLALLLAWWPDQALALAAGGSAALEAGWLGLCGLGLLAWWSLPQVWASPWR